MSQKKKGARAIKKEKKPVLAVILPSWNLSPFGFQLSTGC
jgi:hypothetical protein